MADGVEALEDEIALDRGARGRRIRWADCRSRAREPDNAGGETPEVIGNAGKVIGRPDGKRRDGDEVGVLDSALDAEGEVKADGGVEAAAEDFSQRREGTGVAVLVTGGIGAEPVAVQARLAEEGLGEKPSR